MRHVFSDVDIDFKRLTDTTVNNLKTGALLNMLIDIEKLKHILTYFNESTHIDTSMDSDSYIYKIHNNIESLLSNHSLYIQSRNECIKRGNNAELV